MYLKLNMFSKGNLLSSDNFTGVTNIDDLSTDCDSIGCVEDIDEEDINDEDVEDKSALGRKTMTVLPTVVTNSSNPKTVLVIIPENCGNYQKYTNIYCLCNNVKTREIFWIFGIQRTIIR